MTNILEKIIHEKKDTLIEVKKNNSLSSLEDNKGVVPFSLAIHLGYKELFPLFSTNHDRALAYAEREDI